jgi:hypothetical protein
MVFGKKKNGLVGRAASWDEKVEEATVHTKPCSLVVPKARNSEKLCLKKAV